MKAPKRTVITIITLIILVGTIQFLTVQASTQTTIPKPSVPEFTVQLVTHSYDIPPTPSTTSTIIDPYTGEEQIITTPGTPGYRVENKSIEITIKNQEFTPYTIDTQRISLFYYISRKGHYTEEWGYYPSLTHSRYYTANHIYQSNSDYTIVELNAAPEGEIDFRVQAQIGYYTSEQDYIGVPGAPFTTYTFNGEVSGWSETQTLTIPTPTESPAISPTPNITDTSPPTSPALTEMEAIWGGAIIILVLFGVLGFLGYLIKRK